MLQLKTQNSKKSVCVKTYNYKFDNFKLKMWQCHKTQKLKMLLNSKTQNVTKLKIKL